ncbi:photosystem I reaction center subunit VIII [Mycobacterium florentinum]|uniref:Photosystem I reaction center subunit VIII n=2 Tax=Mycobacterium florentinum TaxID=292462 RepID=A0A1X1U7P4_MYCFL|nr:LLM class flavin-dependent oxidoreductase [Mycobacterium florentinum]ORV52679.1 photosystem I reaction center subunit VIII [Mycobacterium florentinum]
MKFGVVEAPLLSRFGPTTVPEMGYRTARLTGADSFWLSDHLNAFLPRAVMTPKYSGMARLVPDADAFLEPWTTLGALGGRHRFSRTRLGVCVTDAGRRNPAVTAQAVATLHLMTRGRAILGIGTGEREGNEPYGVTWSRPVARFVEALATIRALWDSDGQLVSRDSEFFPLRNAIFALPPVKGSWPKIWVAAHGPRMLRATGRYADGWLPIAIFGPKRYADSLLRVREAADDANRDPNSITAANTQLVMTGRSSAEVDEALDSVPARMYALLLPDSEWAEEGARHPMGQGFTGFQDILPQLLDEATAVAHVDAVPRALMRRCLLSGTPDEVLDQLATYRDHGLQYPVLMNMSAIQPKLGRGLSSALPFLKILRGIRRL